MQQNLHCEQKKVESTSDSWRQIGGMSSRLLEGSLAIRYIAC
ncbi:hypothetical protein [Marinoscillum sp.]